MVVGEKGWVSLVALGIHKDNYLKTKISLKNSLCLENTKKNSAIPFNDGVIIDNPHVTVSSCHQWHSNEQHIPSLDESNISF